jgi:peroxiredoxin
MKIALLLFLFFAANFECLLASPASTPSPSASAPDISNPLLGKNAPDFQLNDLGSTKVKLSDLRGKIVVLDFWRTGCPSCILGLPVLKKVAMARKSQGVVFYAINLNETADAVRGFQKRRDLHFPVLLDSDRKVGDLYQIDYVPVSLIIDRTGRIAAIDPGFNADREMKLNREIDSLLAANSPLPSAPLADAAKPVSGGRL